MIANASPLLVKGNYRIDFSHNFIDGKPLFGSNKTWEGLIIGLYMGSSVTLVYSLLFNEIDYILVGVGSTLFALLGDLLGSFLKRRLNIKSGDPLPVIDQIDFALMVIVYYYLIKVDDFYSKPLFILYALLLIMFLHITTNNIAYYLGVKDKRW
ncbi:MAG: hypothetical protein B6U89_01430 [Desulfurococcales archaeon ex4484_58]|nr:MAG: hypothetical protein B6U89_01430 [Desulfurococcales archaeon ex4484_58]